MTDEIFELKIADKQIIIKTPNWAEQTSGSCLVQCGETVVLVTAVMSSLEKEGMDFLPLTVEFEERYYAAGKIFGSRFIRRETRPSDEAILTARMIDRAIRPLFPNELKREIQIIVTCLSWDGENDPDILGLIGASVVLSISDIPWNGPIGGVRITKTKNKFIINPTYQQRTESEFDLTIAGIQEGEGVLVNMIEMVGKEIKEEEIINATELAHIYIKEIVKTINNIKDKIGKPKETFSVFSEPELEREIKKWLDDKLEKTLQEAQAEKNFKGVEEIKQNLITYLNEKYPNGEKLRYVPLILEKEIKKIIVKNILEKDRRPDGRKCDEIRPLFCQVGILPKTHGSGFFQRGLTRVLSILTLGAPGDSLIIEGMEVVGKKRFMHHYNFPPYCAGEIAPLRAPKRREIGHGSLVEKALLPIIPDQEKFPYTVRIVSEVLSSNGSTSMASTCSSSLALMDAGVPIKEPVAGISIGLVIDEASKNFKVLTDIQGPEDHLGEMDFKVAGTKRGITAIQLDTKIKGINKEIIKEALEKAKEARLKILETMKNVISHPRPSVSPLAPKILVISINPTKIGEVIGPKGSMINKIIQDCGVTIDIEDSGKVFITGTQEEGVKKAADWIKGITKEIAVGDVFTGTVKKITDFGAFVDILPGQTGLVHISKFVRRRLGSVKEVVKEGDKIPVKVLSIDENGRINLSAIDAGFKPPSKK